MRLILFILILVSFLCSQSYTLRGIILDEEGRPLVQAFVELNPGNISTVSDSDGVFISSNIRDGKYTLLVSYLGFRSYEKELVLDRDITLKIEMVSSALQGVGVITTAMRARRDKTPSSFTDISQEKIEKLHDVQDVPMVLQNSPGVYAYSETGTGIGYTHINIRGFGSQRLNVMINGIPFNDPESQGIFWVDLPDLLNNAEDVQIQRGVGFSTNGPASFGGSINIRTKAMGTERTASFEAGYGSFNTVKYSAAFGTGLLQDHLAFYGRISTINSDGYRYKTAADMESWFFSGAYIGTTTSLRLNIYGGNEITQQAWNGADTAMIAQDRRANDLQFSNEIDNYHQPHYELLMDQQLSKNVSLSASLFYIYGQGYFEQFKAAGDYDHAELVLPDSIETDKFIQKWLRNDHFGIQTTFNIQSNAGETHVGLMARRYIGDHFGKVVQAKDVDFEALDPPPIFYGNRGDKDYAAVFINHLWPISAAFSLMADAQLRYIHYTRRQKKMTVYEGYRIEVENLFFNPKLGLMYIVNPRTQVYASAGISQREPTDDDYFDAKDPEAKPNFSNVSIDQSTDPNISSEKVTDFELGIRFDTGEYLKADVNVYYMLFDNEIVANGQVDDEGNPIHVNTEESFRSGIEIGLNGQFGNFFYGINHAYNYSRLSKYTDYVDEFTPGWDYLGTKEFVYRNIQPAYTPAIVMNNQVGYQYHSLRLALIHNYVSDQFMENTENVNARVNAYNLVNLSIEYMLPRFFGGQPLLTFKINNILNEEYEQPAFIWWKWYQNGAVNYNSRYYVGAPRNYYLSFKLNF